MKHLMGAPATAARRAWALLAALLVGIACMGVASGLAWATETEESSTVTVGLTIYDTTDNTTVYNDAVTVSADATVADLLEAAGFTEADTLADTADGASYYDSWSCPYFLAKGYDADTYCYWVAMYEGDGWSNYASAYLTATVQDGGHYQYIYGSSSYFDYDDYDDLDDPLIATVALTIYDTTDSYVLYNAAVDVSITATVADLLEEAGFAEASTLADTADGASYYDSWSCPYFLAKGYDADTYCYWVAMYEGDGWNNYADAYLTATVQDGGHYQYIYGSSSYFDYDDYDFDDPLATTEDTDDDEDGDEDGEDESEESEESEVAAPEYDATSTATLLENLTVRFSDGGSDEAISNSTVYAAIALNALGLGSQIDTDAILASLESYEETYGYSIGAGTLAKYIMALTAGGYDCTELVAQMEALEDGTENVYSTVWILAVYDYGGYTVGGDSAWTIDGLIDAIIASIDDEGLVGAWGYSDTQTTAQAILALVAYADDEEVAAALATMAAGIAAYANADGGYGYASYSTDSNLDATANIVAALVALGSDTTDAVAWLVAQADDTLDGYEDSALSYDETMSSATVLMALAAYEGSSAGTAAYSVYDLVGTVAESDDDETDADTDTEAESEDADEDEDASLAATGDPAAAAAAAAGSLALCALAGYLVAARRKSEAIC